ncbi:MAG: acetyltransferase [Halobacteriales archaeon SW_9_67_25]|nr:MAG: acetyltransferase [Halobacteriales archaeon SW_9_67_25]
MSDTTPGESRSTADSRRTGDGEGDDGHEDDVGRATARHERLTAHARPGPGTSLRKWYRVRNPLRVVLNYVVIVVCRISPSLRLKRWLLRRVGVTVGSGVAWGLESTPDVFWPDLVTVEADAVIGYDATILCHEFLVDEYRTGEVVIGERAMIGAGTVVLPGVEVGPGARVAANSLVASDVRPGATVAGIPATPVDDETRQGTDRSREPEAGE